MNKSKIINYKLLITIIIVAIFIWFLVISPVITFHSNEKQLMEAAKRYYDLNSDKLPVGERVKTLSLNVLYKEAYLKNDLKAPYSGKVCSLEKSWVKVVHNDGEYRYYTYLDCGLLKSTVDHKGPVIKLNGDQNIVINVGDKFKDPGVKSVTDNTDGKMDIKNVKTKSNLDTKKIGNYEIEYSISDSLNNKTVIVRNVTVVRKLNNTVKKALGKEKYYKGIDADNYLYFSNNLYRILSIDGDNVKIVSATDISFVNYDGIDEWFKYYESNLTSNSKKLIIKNKYCNMSVSEKDLGSTSCKSYGKKTKFGMLSIDDINNSIKDGDSYLIQKSITWTANKNGEKNAFAFRNQFNNTDSKYYSFEKTHNLGVRPVLTIDGNTLIIEGDGTSSNPYVLTDYVKLQKNSKINTRYVGEYISYSGYLWRIQGVESDGTTKIILNQSLYDDNGELISLYYDDKIKNTQYNPEEKGNVGYYINNYASKYIDTSYFTKHQIEVPIYNGEPSYKKQVSINKYKVKISSPNMYDMYSASTLNASTKSYWLLNSSKSKTEIPGVSETGSIMYGSASVYYSYGIRPVVYLKDGIVVTSGKGTISEPFIIKK